MKLSHRPFKGKMTERKGIVRDLKAPKPDVFDYDYSEYKHNARKYYSKGREKIKEYHGK